jgi:sulfite reductase beta subunit-like hemoprotein
VRVLADDLDESLARLFNRYKGERLGAETFQEFCLRHSNEDLARYMAGPTTPAESRAVCEASTVVC